MSWHFLQESAAASWDPGSADGLPVVLLKLTPIVAEYCSPARPTAPCQGSLFGTISEPLTPSRGAARSISSRPAGLARTYHPPAQETASTAPGRVSGERQSGWWLKWDHEQYSWKTRQFCLWTAALDTFSGNWPNSGMMRNGECWARTMQEHPTNDTASGWWHTPVAGDSHGAGPNQHVASLGRDVRRKHGGVVSPEFAEWIMGYPIGWSALQPLETAKYRLWLSLHGRPGR